MFAFSAIYLTLYETQTFYCFNHLEINIHISHTVMSEVHGTFLIKVLEDPSKIFFF